MEEFIQFSAKTKNEAITKACIELGVSSDQLEIEVVSEGSSGFFGIGSKPAIIKARKINTVSEEDEIQEIVDTVKVDAIKEEQTRKPAKTFVKAEKPAPKSEPEKAAVKEAKEPKSFKETKDFLKNYNITGDDICKNIYQTVINEPANYLQYYVGYLEITALKEKVQKQLGTDFNLKDFHKSFLTIGPADFKTVEKWIYTFY